MKILNTKVDIVAGELKIQDYAGLIRFVLNTPSKGWTVEDIRTELAIFDALEGVGETMELSTQQVAHIVARLPGEWQLRHRAIPEFVDYFNSL